MNIEIQCCALLMLIILFTILVREKSLDLNRRKRFVDTMISCMLCVTMDILSVIAIVSASRGLFPVAATTVICKLYLVFLINVGYRGFLYVAGEFFEENTHKLLRNTYRVIFYVGVLCIILLPIDYYCSGRVVYSYGPSALATYSMAFILLVSTVIMAFAGGKATSRRRKRVIILWQFSWIVASLIQFLRPDLLVVSFAASFGIILVYAELENPNEGIDRTTGQFTYNELYTYVIDLFKRGSPFSAMHISADYGAGNFDLDLELSAMRRIAKFLESNNKSSYVFRESDRDFVVIYKDRKLMETDYERASRDLESIVDMPVNITYTLIPDSGIFENADEFMQYQHYSEKNTVTSGCTIANKEQAEHMRDYFKRRDQIIWALSNEGIEVYYQPIFDVEAKAFTTAEALVRLHDSDGNLLQPTHFIPIAEENGLIIPLGNEVFRQVCQLLATGLPQQYGLDSMEVNLSMAQFSKGEPAHFVQKTLAEYGVDPHLINLEITETADPTTKRIILKNMEVLIDKGVRFSLDDFGTGRSNFDYLFAMPLDMVKFDCKFTHWYFENETSKRVVESIVDIMSGMDLPMVMEGVETKEQLDAMMDLGASFIQGFYYSKPLPREEFLEFLRNNKSTD